MTATRLLRLLALPPVWVTLLAIALVVAYQSWLHALGAAHLERGGLTDVAGPVDVEVAFAVAPEQYHMQRLQDAGRLVRADASRAVLREVPPERLRALARNYWIAGIRPWSGP